MGALAALCISIDEDPTPLIQRMTGALAHRAPANPTVVTSEGRDHKSWFSLAYAGNRILDRDRDHPLTRGKLTLALDGRLNRSYKSSDIDYCSRKLGPSPSLAKFRQLILSEKGMYALVGVSETALIAARDPLGIKPLYFAGIGHGIAIASERKALWAIGCPDPQPVEPGSLMVAREMTQRFMQVFQLRKPKTVQISLNSAAQRLERHLRRAFGLLTRDLERFAIAFSGGLDSAVTAALAKDSDARCELFTVGLEGSDELSQAEEIAEELGMKQRVATHNLDQLESYVRRVLWLIEEPNLMKLSVAIPLHWTAELARSHGFRVIFTGQGSDELFGGYRKFKNLYQTNGRKAVERALFQAVANSYLVNFQRDEQATAPLGVELRSVFCDLDVVDFGLSLPLDMKVTGPEDEMRKHVLRSAAKRLGLPPRVYGKRKRAIQHGTGVEKAIINLAQERKMKPQKFLESLHLELRQSPKMP